MDTVVEEAVMCETGIVIVTTTDVVVLRRIGTVTVIVIGTSSVIRLPSVVDQVVIQEMLDLVVEI